MQQVSGQKDFYKPSLGQYEVYNYTFGYLTAPPGFCSKGACHVYAAVNDEFGCALNTLCSVCHMSHKGKS
jgi:hypothetical protein